MALVPLHTVGPKVHVLRSLPIAGTPPLGSLPSGTSHYTTEQQLALPGLAATVY